MGVKDVESFFKEIGFVLEDNDIGLSNMRSETSEIKEATGSSENIPADGLEMYPDMLPVDYTFLHTMLAPLGCSMNPRGQPSSFNLLASHHVRKFSDCDLEASE